MVLTVWRRASPACSVEVCEAKSVRMLYSCQLVVVGHFDEASRFLRIESVHYSSLTFNGLGHAVGAYQSCEVIAQFDGVA